MTRDEGGYPAKNNPPPSRFHPTPEGGNALTIASEYQGTDNPAMPVLDNPAALVMDIPETAHWLRCGRSTVYSLLKDGELTGIKIGRRRLVTYESAVAFVRRQAAG